MTTVGSARTGRWTCSRQLHADSGVELSCGYRYRLLRRLGCRRGKPHPGLRIPVRGRRKTQCFAQFLDLLVSRYRRAKRLHLVLDNHIIHKAKCVQSLLADLGGRVVLHFLPPYSPDDNTIERLWKQLHDQVTRNHRHRTIDTLVHAVRRFFNSVQPFPGAKVSTMRAA